MSIYTVDEDGQIFITPNELDDFEYYRDNIFVRTYEEFLSANPYEYETEPEPFGWQDMTDNTFWESQNESIISWDAGGFWDIKTADEAVLLPLGTWVVDYRPGFMRITNNDTVDVVMLKDTNNQFLSYETSYENGQILAIIDDAETNLDFGSLTLKDYQGNSEVSKIEFASYATVLGQLEQNVVSDLTSLAGYYIQTGDIYEDSSGYLHITGNYSSALYYFTNATGSWTNELVYASNFAGYVSRVCVIGSTPNIIFSDYYGGGDIKHAYKDGTWTVDDIDSDTGMDLSPQYLDMWVDGNDTIHIAYYSPTDDELRYAYKTTGGSWSTPENLVTSLAACNKVSIVTSNGYVYIAYMVAGSVLKLITNESASWVTTDIETGYNFFQYGMNLFVNSSGNIVCIYQYDLGSPDYDRPFRYLERVAGTWTYKNTGYQTNWPDAYGVALLTMSFDVSSGEAVSFYANDIFGEGFDVARVFTLGPLTNTDNALVYGQKNLTGLKNNRIPSPTNKHHAIGYISLNMELYYK